MSTKKKNVNVLFWIRQSRAKEGLAPLYCRVTIRGQRYEILLDVKPRLKAWSSSLQKCIGKNSLDRIVNQAIDNIALRIDDTLELLYKKQLDITVSNFALMYNREENEYSTINKLFDYHEIMERSKLAPGSYRGYMVTRKHMLDYIRIKYHAADYNVASIDKNFVFEFFAYLQGYRRQGSIKCQTNGALKHIARFRRVMNLALANEWIDRNPVCLLKVQKDKVDIGYITHEELERMEAIELKPCLAIVRDIFIFSCFTGAAFSDIRTLSNRNRCIGIDKSLWLNYNRHKTNVRCPIPLLSPAEELIARYSSYHEYKQDSPLFPVPSNQTVNRYLKMIAKLAHIDKDLTFHMARHTFATTITLSAGVPIETVSKMLGHTSLTTTQIYAKVVDTKVKDDMAELKLIYSKHSNNKKAI